MTTKILALTDALGNLARFELLPGQRYDTIGVAPLIKGLEFGGLIADKAFDTNWVVAAVNERGAKVVISQRPKRKAPLDIDQDVYKWRHLIENFFCKLKEFKRVAMRSDKTDTSFAAMIHLGAAIINSRRFSTDPSAAHGAWPRATFHPAILCRPGSLNRDHDRIGVARSSVEFLEVLILGHDPKTLRAWDLERCRRTSSSSRTS